MTFSTLALGFLLICLPLELRELHATPNQIGLTLAMFGFGMFAFEMVWGVLGDRIGYRIPLVLSQLLFAGCIVLLSRADTIVLIAIGYFAASGMLVAAGPLARSYLGTALHSRLRATGLALLTAQWVIAEAVGSGAGGQLIEHFPIRSVLLASAVLPVVSALLALWVFKGYSHSKHVDSWTADDEARMEEARGGGSVMRVLMVTASMVLLLQIGAGGELALLPLLVTAHLHLSAASAGAAMLVAGVVGGVLLVPGGMASDRWGRKPTMIAGGLISAVGFGVYATAIGLGGYHLPDMDQVASISHQYYDNHLRGGEGHMEVGKLINTVKHRKAHMVISVKPFGCMPSSGVSDGIQSLITARYPEAIFTAIETTGDGEVNVQSRIQMDLFKARAKAEAEYKDALSRSGLGESDLTKKFSKRSKALHHPPHVVAGTAANQVLELAGIGEWSA